MIKAQLANNFVSGISIAFEIAAGNKGIFILPQLIYETGSWALAANDLKRLHNRVKLQFSVL